MLWGHHFFLLSYLLLNLWESFFSFTNSILSIVFKIEAFFDQTVICRRITYTSCTSSTSATIIFQSPAYNLEINQGTYKQRVVTFTGLHHFGTKYNWNLMVDSGNDWPSIIASNILHMTTKLITANDIDDWTGSWKTSNWPFF